MIALAQQPKPEQAQLGEDLSLVRDAVGQDPVEGADSIGADDQQGLTQVINVANFAATQRQAGKVGLQDDGRFHRVSFSRCLPRVAAASGV